jgi:hypothetical protein
VRGSIPLAAQCHCVPVNSDVMPLKPSIRSAAGLLLFAGLLGGVALNRFPVHAQSVPVPHSDRIPDVATQASSRAPALQGYYERLAVRIKREAEASPPMANGRPLRGKAVVKLTIGTSGELMALTTEDASSRTFEKYTDRLFRRLAPFEPLPMEIRSRTDRVEVATTFAYPQERK